MFRYETHLHTYEGSLCGVTPGSMYPQYYKDLVNSFVLAGYIIKI